MGFSKTDFDKLDDRIKKITEQAVNEIEINSELPPTIEQFEYSANGRPLVTVEKSTQYADQVHLAQKLNTLKSPLWI